MITMATGHRPQKLGGFGQAAELKRLNLARLAVAEMKPDEAISGMALGWDTAWAIACIEAGIPLIAACPFRGQEKVWNAESRAVYDIILESAAEIVYVDELDGYGFPGLAPGVYHPGKLQTRNEWMADNSGSCAAIWDGTKGGTGNCIRYIESEGLAWRNFYPEWKGMR